MISRKKRTVLNITLSGLFFGLVYPVFGDDELIEFINGAMVGMCGAFLLALSEIWLLRGIQKKLSFPAVVAVKTLIYTSVFTGLLIIFKILNESLYYGLTFEEYIKSQRFQDFLFEEDLEVILLYALTLVGLIIFVMQISRKMGQGVLFNLITGRYHEPREEERIFMLLDLRSSTQIAEKMQINAYYEFINEFFHDITPHILSSGGEIYRYVGDQVMVSWIPSQGLKNASCIRCFFNIKNEIERRREKYLLRFGLFPQFVAAFHIGQVVTGSVGDVKSQIVFHGEAIYTAAALEKKCGAYEVDIIVSEELQNKLDLPIIYSSHAIGVFQNDNSSLKLFTITEKEVPTV